MNSCFPFHKRKLFIKLLLRKWIFSFITIHKSGKIQIDRLITRFFSDWCRWLFHTILKNKTIIVAKHIVYTVLSCNTTCCFYRKVLTCNAFFRFFNLCNCITWFGVFHGEGGSMDITINAVIYNTLIKLTIYLQYKT